ncbi:hypothetical protein [Oceanispirochaeta sp. M2]|nr:hypothetical protein [Oceanispirochaeta sp. M2]MBF9015919.1 hypothetical protein [Oceanispirochaeta sp. M2]NPD72382.1 hypothetical protein [Oceanispirochaeta sp. M1]
MMKKRNIYKMDDILLFLSLAMLALLVFISWDWLSIFKEAENLTAFLLMAPEVLGARLYPVIMYGLAAVTAQIIGRYIRFLEKKSLLILDELEKSSKIRVSDLCMKLGMSQAKVKKLVVKLSRVPSLGIELDGERVIQKRVSNISVKDNHSFNSNENSTPDSKDKGIPEDMAEAFMRGDLPPQFKAAMKSGGAVSRAAGVAAGLADGESSKKKGLPLPLLIFLFFTPLWPVAVFLIFRSSMKNMKRANEES